jgi:glycerophosphoryl diester phosphodiesterase
MFPQAIAHRGYKAAHPENTFKAFQGAVEVGAHAIETDIHLTKDDVVVLSHDGDLKRCFGRKEKIIDCDWDLISELRTIKAPHEPMPRLQDLLQYIAQPGLEDIWILLDIKLDNNAENVMRLIKATIDSVPANPSRSWDSRIVLGIWAVKFLPLCQTYLPSFPISHIGFSTCYARQFLKVENCSFNMLQKVLFGPIGANFIKDVRKAGRQLFVWTVNDENLMKWSIQRHVDGVITDDPKKFKEVCDNYGDHEPTANPGVYQWLLVPYSYCFHSYRWYRRVALTNPGRYTFWLVPQSKAHESESPVANTS